MIRRLLTGSIVVVVGWLAGAVSSLSQQQSVVLPLQNKYSSQTESLLRHAFHEIVDSTDFFEHHSAKNADDTAAITCNVPLFGDKVQVTLRQQQSKIVFANDESSNGGGLTNYMLVVSDDDTNVSDEEFGWICAKFYECRDSFGGAIDLSDLRSLVAGHFNSLAPHPGYAAAPWSGSPRAKKLFADASILKELEEEGFVVIEAGPKTSVMQNKKLSKFLVEKTNQGKAVRRDTVHFLDEGEAYSCGLEDHYEFVMSFASHLNDNLQFRTSPHRPLHPATQAKPLTIPRSIQLAEYGENDFYKAHSDNSLASKGVRSNFRHYTCILYCNDDWTPDMGGALRLYPGSRDFSTPEDAQVSCSHVDINPLNGRLLIFDSCLTHSVEKVLQSHQARRALTLWITRPDDSGVKGEVFF